MNKMIPIDLSLAHRLAATKLDNPFCGFCRTERAAVEELKAAMAVSPTGRLPTEPEVLQVFRQSEPGRVLVEADFSQLEERVLAHMEQESLITSWRHPLVNIAEWRKGCSCAVPAPGECQECTEALIKAIEGWLLGNLPHDPNDTLQVSRKLVRDILERTGKALGKDKLVKLMWVPEEVQALADKLEQAQATIKEMGELIDQQAAELEQLRKLTGGATLTHKTKGGYYRLLGEAEPAGVVKRYGVALTVYQDTMSGKLYYRSINDFAAALEPL